MGFHSNIHLQEDVFYINLRLSVNSHLKIFHWVWPEKLLIGQIRAHRLAPLGALPRTGAEWQWSWEVGWEKVSLLPVWILIFFHTSHIQNQLLCIGNRVIELNNKWQGRPQEVGKQSKREGVWFQLKLQRTWSCWESYGRAKVTRGNRSKKELGRRAVWPITALRRQRERGQTQCRNINRTLGV